MAPCVRNALISLILVLAGSANAAWATKPLFKDNVPVFDARTAMDVSELLEQIRADYAVDLVITTVNKIPLRKDLLRRFPGMNAVERDRFLKTWVQHQVPGPNGIAVLIYQDPKYANVQIEVGRDLQRQKVITARDGEQLRADLQGGLDNHNIDAVLLAALRSVQTRLKDHFGGPITPQPFPWGGTFTIVGSGLWCLLLLVLMQSSPGENVAVSGGMLSLISPEIGPWATLRAVWSALEPLSHPHMDDHEHPHPLFDDPSPDVAAATERDHPHG